jgi:hypothetical protein
MLYKGDHLRLTIPACYSWGTALNGSLSVSFGNMQDWKRVLEETGEAYVTNDEISRSILTGCYTNYMNFHFVFLCSNIWGTR